MSTASEQTKPIWIESSRTAALPTPPPLTEDLSTDTVVVGGGIAGLSTAYALACAGRQVVVLDDGPIGGGNTGRTTAHLSNALDDRFTNLIRERGVDVAATAAASHGAAINFIERVQATEGIRCDFRRLDGYLVLGEDDDGALLDRELRAAHEAGLREVEKLARPPEGAPNAPCLRFPRQGRFHPLAYLRGLAAAFERRGGRIRQAQVAGVADGTPVRIETSSGRQISADAAVVATATPINDRVQLHTKLAPYRTYAIAGAIAPGSIPDALIWDTVDPYHYVRLAEVAGRPYAIIGGEDHKTGQSDDETAALQRLLDWATARYPIKEAPFRWSGQVMETIDGLGFIGRNPGDENVYVVTGDSGMGMTHGTIAGILIPALIATGHHPWQAAYDPARKPLSSPGTLIAENANVGAQFIDYVTPGDVRDFDDIARGEGAVLRHKASKIAAYRDERGRLHVRSAVCPHLGCLVRWNRLEKVWDCPCHGSQFAPTGRVLHGPAVTALATVRDFNEDRNPNVTAGDALEAAESVRQRQRPES